MVYRSVWRVKEVNVKCFLIEICERRLLLLQKAMAPCRIVNKELVTGLQSCTCGTIQHSNRRQAARSSDPSTCPTAERDQWAQGDFLLRVAQPSAFDIPKQRITVPTVVEIGKHVQETGLLLMQQSLVALSCLIVKRGSKVYLHISQKLRAEKRFSEFVRNNLLIYEKSHVAS